jgi:precorrin-8X/cobalt-precorrin-8 methylmutase
MMFDAFVMVDWSAATVPRTGRDSIWICWHEKDGDRFKNPSTRYAAKALLTEWLAAAWANGKRVLIGFDFPFGYPAGFAAKLNLPGAPWRAVWDEIARLLKDDERNGNNRFDIAADFNQRVSNGPFPFWGCPAGKSGPFLKPTFHRAHDGTELAERRLVDRRDYMPGAQPCWKLCYTGSVGSQALTGIPIVRALRDYPPWRQQACVWPFETGLAGPASAQLVFAEVYPSLWQHGDEKPKDKAQVLAVCRFFAERDRSGELATLFAGDPSLTSEQRFRVETEEAWTLGVTAARQRPIAVSPAAAHRAPTLTLPRLRGREITKSTASQRPTSLTLPRQRGREGWGLSGESEGPAYTYIRDPAEITRRSFALIREEADLARFPRRIQPVALRLAHAAGDSAILGDLEWSKGAVAAGRKALAAGATILVDSAMVAAGVMIDPNRIVCTLRDPETTRQAASQGTTRSAAAVERWRPHLPGAVIAIGNAPTALFRLLELLACGAPKPALVLGFPVGFVGAAEAKAALAAFGHGLEFITLRGRRGGSALAAAAVNALASTV